MLYKPNDLQVNGVNLVDLSVETRSIPLKMASRMVSTSFLMALSLAIFCVTRAQSQEQYCKKNLKYFQKHEVRIQKNCQNNSCQILSLNFKIKT